jgi:hypothetical protein
MYTTDHVQMKLSVMHWLSGGTMALWLIMIGLLSIIIHIGLDDPNTMPLMMMSLGGTILGAVLAITIQVMFYYTL